MKAKKIIKCIRAWIAMLSLIALLFIVGGITENMLPLGRGVALMAAALVGMAQIIIGNND